MLTLLDSYEFSIRRPIIQLLTGLLRHRASEVQNILMQDPMAINRLLDLLQESREVLRNDVSPLTLNSVINSTLSVSLCSTVPLRCGIFFADFPFLRDMCLSALLTFRQEID